VGGFRGGNGGEGLTYDGFDCTFLGGGLAGGGADLDCIIKGFVGGGLDRFDPVTAGGRCCGGLPVRLVGLEGKLCGFDFIGLGARGKSSDFML